jgi:hypothetical protein
MYVYAYVCVYIFIYVYISILVNMYVFINNRVYQHRIGEVAKKRVDAQRDVGGGIGGSVEVKRVAKGEEIGERIDVKSEDIGEDLLVDEKEKESDFWDRLLGKGGQDGMVGGSVDKGIHIFIYIYIYIHICIYIYVYI